MFAFLCGAAVAGLFGWLSWVPVKRWKLGEIQQHCAKEGRAQLDDTARVLQVLRSDRDLLKSLLKMGPPDETNA